MATASAAEQKGEKHCKKKKKRLLYYVHMCAHIYIYIYIHTYIVCLYYTCIYSGYIYIYIKREREREREIIVRVRVCHYHNGHLTMILPVPARPRNPAERPAHPWPPSTPMRRPHTATQPHPSLQSTHLVCPRVSWLTQGLLGFDVCSSLSGISTE